MILIAYGTRPEYIKVKPLMEEMKKNNISFKVLFTGQHMDIAPSDANFNMQIFNTPGNNRLDNVLSACLSLSKEVFSDIKYVLVQGDTTTALGLSLAAFHRKISVIHLEAGLRTFDFENPYPEEMNRVLISKIAKIHLCPTDFNKKNLLLEGISEKDIYVVGNTGLDNLLPYKNKCNYGNKILVTMHRRENHENIEQWFLSIEKLAISYPELEFIIPIHPNPNVKKHENLLHKTKVVSPLSHEDLLKILLECKLVITDSGGIQEECSFLNKKCIVCRKTTERPESVGLTSFLCPTPNSLDSIFLQHINNYEVDINSPFGDGTASKKIIQVLKDENI